jgi:hypothetical protein
MSKIRLIISGIVVVTMAVALASAADITTKKLFIKDNANPAKRVIQVLSKDTTIAFSQADDPATNGAALHVYSATDDYCLVLPGGPEWQSKKSKWQYKNKTTKNALQIKDGKIIVKIKNDTFPLSANGTQGMVNAQLQFGTGTRFCMRCPGKKDDAKKFLGKDCVAAACDPEPSVCAVGSGTSTTTVVGASTTSTTGCTPSGSVVKGALTPTVGRFNYNVTLGLPGANAACNSNFPGTHACTIQELQTAEASCDLRGLLDTASHPVTSFWAIDGTAPALQQCNDDAAGGSGLNWEYGTAHTPSRGSRVTLSNATGTLGSVQTGVQCNLSGTSNVGCCQ